jgi:ATP-dependent RNA helicase DeaD
MQKFQDLGLDASILDALAQKGYSEPTPIQAKVIPILLDRSKNVVGQAQTGTGKTAAFGLPIIQNIELNTRNVQAIVLAPTRELAVQVANEIDSYKGTKRIQVTTVYGGQPIDRQIRELQKGADVVVGTPGRVIDLIKRGKLKLDEVKYFVLDEADEMLNMGFIEDIEFILSETNDDKQVLLFSATMPKKILKLQQIMLINNIMQLPLEIK